MKRFSNTVVCQLALGGLLWFGTIPAVQAMQDTSKHELQDRPRVRQYRDQEW